jgi:hypothetical protein
LIGGSLRDEEDHSSNHLSHSYTCRVCNNEPQPDSDTYPTSSQRRSYTVSHALSEAYRHASSCLSYFSAANPHAGTSDTHLLTADGDAGVTDEHPSSADTDA